MTELCGSMATQAESQPSHGAEMAGHPRDPAALHVHATSRWSARRIIKGIVKDPSVKKVGSPRKIDLA